MRTWTFLLLLPAATFVARAQAAPPAPGLLRAMQRAEATASYRGVAWFARAGQPAMTMRVARSGFKRRIEWLSPPVMRGDVMADDGQTLWRFEKSERAAFALRGPGRSAGSQMDASGPLEGAQLLGSEKVAGRAAWVVSVASPGGGQRKWWIDKATKLRLRFARFGPRGRLLENLALQQVKFGPQPAAQFAFVPPRGTAVTRIAGTLHLRLAEARAAAPWLRAPAYLPPGYGFESVIIEPGGEAWLRFSNGLRRFSIFQQRAPGADTSPQPVEGGWFVREDGSRFAVVGAPEDEGRRVAASLR